MVSLSPVAFSRPLLLDKYIPGAYNTSISGAGWSSLEARRAHNPKVIGSNPIPATEKGSHHPSGEGFLFCTPTRQKAIGLKLRLSPGRRLRSACAHLEPQVSKLCSANSRSLLPGESLFSFLRLYCMLPSVSHRRKKIPNTFLPNEAVAINEYLAYLCSLCESAEHILETTGSR